MFAENIAAILAKHHTTLLCVGPEDCMKIDDLPLPLRLRNALAKAGFKDADGLRDWLSRNGEKTIAGVGETGQRQLKQWAAEVPAPRGGPEVIRRPARREEPAEERAAGVSHDERAEDYRRDDVVSPQSAVPGRWNQLAGDVSMRGGLEALRDEPLVPMRISHQWDAAPAVKTSGLITEQQGRDADQTIRVRDLASKLDIQRAAVESIDTRRPQHDMNAINKRQFDAALEKEVARSFGLTGTGSFGDPDEDIKRRGAEFRAAGGSVAAGNGRGTLILRLESDIQDRLRAMIPVIKGLAHVKELGVEVSAETVGRMALIRGLDALEKAHSVKNGAPKAEKEADPAPDEPISAAEPLNGVHPTPDGWARCGPNDKIPVPEAVLHDYYAQNGWDRYWGKAGDSVIYFYWTPEMGKQGLDAFPGSDKNGRRIAVQDTPWGPGHIVPANWLNS